MDSRAWLKTVHMKHVSLQSRKGFARTWDIDSGEFFDPECSQQMWNVFVNEDILARFENGFVSRLRLIWNRPVTDLKVLKDRRHIFSSPMFRLPMKIYNQFSGNLTHVGHEVLIDVPQRNIKFSSTFLKESDHLQSKILEIKLASECYK